MSFKFSSDDKSNETFNFDFSKSEPDIIDEFQTRSEEDDPSTLAYVVKHVFVKSYSTNGDADDSVPSAHTFDTDDFLM